MNRLLNKEFKIENVICTLMFIMGLFMSFIVPSWQTPDEPTHLRYIAEAIDNEDFYENILDDLELDTTRIAFHPEEKMDWNKQLTVMTKAPSYTRSEMMPHKISFSLIKHLPSFIGLMIGILLGLPAYWTMQLGELSALLFYVFMCYHAIKIMPYKKQLFGMTLIVPTALQQCTSIGYDVVVLGLCAFYIAYTFYLKYTKERIETKDILKMFGLFLLITYAKLPYVLFGLLVFLLPADKIHLQVGKFCIDEAFLKKYRIPLIAGFIGCIVLGVYLLRNNFWIQILIGCALEPLRVLELFRTTWINWGIPTIAYAIGCFGWNDIAVDFKIAAIVYIVFFLVAMVKMNSQNGKEMTFRKWDYFVIWGTYILLIIMTVLSMVNHAIMTTLYGSEFVDETYNIREALYMIPYIGGLQGRYFIPYLCLPFLGLPCKLDWNNRKVCIVTYALEIIFFVYVIILLLYRFWIV